MDGREACAAWQRRTYDRRTKRGGTKGAITSYLGWAGRVSRGQLRYMSCCPQRPVCRISATTTGHLAFANPVWIRNVWLLQRMVFSFFYFYFLTRCDSGWGICVQEDDVSWFSAKIDLSRHSNSSPALSPISVLLISEECGGAPDAGGGQYFLTRVP